VVSCVQNYVVYWISFLYFLKCVSYSYWMLWCSENQTLTQTFICRRYLKPSGRLTSWRTAVNLSTTSEQNWVLFEKRAIRPTGGPVVHSWNERHAQQLWWLSPHKTVARHRLNWFRFIAHIFSRGKSNKASLLHSHVVYAAFSSTNATAIFLCKAQVISSGHLD